MNADEFVKAMGHPIRVQVINLIATKDRAMSPSELAEELDLPLPNVSYHVRKLKELDFLRLAKTKARRGAVEHYYTVQKGAIKQGRAKVERLLEVDLSD